MDSENKLLKTAEILERDWTRGLIKKFLSEPDKIHKILTSVGKAHLYDENRVLLIEQTEEFKAAKQIAMKRRNKSIEITEKRKNDVLAQAQALSINVRRIDIDKLTKLVVNEHNYGMPVTDENVLERMTVNFIRHELTEYDKNLSDQFGKIGKVEAVKIIRRNIFKEMLRIYPEFSYQIKKQAAEREIYIY